VSSAEPNDARVLILSDTHLRDAAGLPAAILQAAEHADHIIHAGDHSSLDVIRVLEQWAPVTAVHGNVEDADVVAALPGVARVDIGGARFGVVHDAGPSHGRVDRLAARFDDCQVVVYGHSHTPEVREASEGRWIVNPGSPTQRRRAPHHTFAWCEVTGGRCRIRLVQLALIVMALSASLLVGGCGRNSDPAGTRSSSGSAAPEAGGADQQRAPSATQIALAAEHDVLLRAYAPISRDVNVVVAAVRLRDGTAATPASVRAAGRAYAKVVADALRTVRAAGTTSAEAGALRAALVRCAVQRLRALEALELWVASGGPQGSGGPGAGRPLAGPAPGASTVSATPSAASALTARARFDALWERSVGSARGATNIMQITRERAGLPGRHEDAIR